LRAVLHRDLAFRILQGTDVRDAHSHLRAAIRLANRGGYDQLKSDAEAALLSELVIAGNLPPNLFERLAALAGVAESPDGVVPAGSRLVSVGAVYKWLDDFDTARSLFGKLRQQAWERLADGALAPPLFQLAELECWAGRLDEARGYVDELHRLSTRADRPVVTAMHRYVQALLNARSGDIDASIDPRRTRRIAGSGRRVDCCHDGCGRGT
jgi:tetratricopeptide (TPR) repeat protein